MTSPTVEVGRIRMLVGGVGATMKVKDEFVGRKEQVAHAAFDALGTRTIVSNWNETSWLMMYLQV